MVESSALVKKSYYNIETGYGTNLKWKQIIDEFAAERKSEIMNLKEIIKD